MSDLKPSELTAEERAIVDHEASRFHRDWTAEARYKTAFDICKSLILARRALFAPPASEEKVTCPNCKQQAPASYSHWEMDQPLGGPPLYTCQPARPEPAAMSGELLMVLLCAEMNAAKDEKNGATVSADITRAAIAAVRAQAAAPKVVKMEKVREAMALLGTLLFEYQQHMSFRKERGAIFDAALAELDAHEGRKP